MVVTSTVLQYTQLVNNGNTQHMKLNGMFNAATLTSATSNFCPKREC